MKPINAISLYDHGFISVLYSSFSAKKAEELELFYLPKINHGRLSSEFSRISFLMRVPMFILTQMVNYDIKIMYAKSDEEQYFLPTEADIVGCDLETALQMKAVIEETTAALQINPSALVADGCNPEVSQILTPVSRYVTIITEAKKSEWLRLCGSIHEKKLSNQFAKVLQGIISSEDISS